MRMKRVMSENGELVRRGKEYDEMDKVMRVEGEGTG